MQHFLKSIQKNAATSYTESVKIYLKLWNTL